MRGVSPSQTLPSAGGQPPTPPGSVSPLHHDQRPALDPLIHHTKDSITSSQTSSPWPRPTRRPITAPYINPHAPKQICRHELQNIVNSRGVTESTRTTSTPANPCRRRIVPGPRRRRAQIRTQSRSKPRKSTLYPHRRRFTAPEAASGRRRGPGRRQMYCVCSCACICDRVCPTRYDRGAEANAAAPPPYFVPGVCRQLQLRVSPSCIGAPTRRFRCHLLAPDVFTPARSFRPASPRRRNCEGATFRDLRKHNSPLIPSRLNLHNVAGPARRRDDHDRTTTRTPHAETPASLSVTPAGASTARSSHAPAPPCHPEE